MAQAQELTRIEAAHGFRRLWDAGLGKEALRLGDIYSEVLSRSGRGLSPEHSYFEHMRSLVAEIDVILAQAGAPHAAE